jgi:hypothetical protein
VPELCLWKIRISLVTCSWWYAAGPRALRRTARAMIGHRRQVINRVGRRHHQVADAV